MKYSIHTINFQIDSTSHKIQIKGHFSALFFLSELHRKPHDIYFFKQVCKQMQLVYFILSVLLTFHHCQKDNGHIYNI